jgi:endoglycosylceramidase
MNTRVVLIFVLLLAVSSCKKAEDISGPSENNAFLDEYGRTMILHGASLFTNDDPGGYTRYTTFGAKRMKEQWGLNTVRMFWNWHSIEPDSAVFSSENLEKLAGIVETFTNEGIYVVLAVNGTATTSQHLVSGTWMAPTGNAENNPSLSGPLNPAVQESMRRFWDYEQYPYLQDEFIKASMFVANRFKDNPYVLGYDIINEPWGSSLLGSVLSTELETKLLPAFYDRYISRMRTVTTEQYIFFEPDVKFNSKETGRFLTNLPFIHDASSRRKLSFAPHLYIPHTDGPPAQNPYLNTLDAFLKLLGTRYEQIQNKQQTPFYIGEWSYIDIRTFEDWEQYLNGHLALFDSLQYSWSYFGYFPDGEGYSLADKNDQEETPIVNKVSRPYPMATSGKLNRFKYLPETRVFEMDYVSNPAIRQPTEIYIPKRHYSNGYELTISGTDKYRTSFDQTGNILSIYMDDAANVRVLISPK